MLPLRVSYVPLLCMAACIAWCQKADQKGGLRIKADQPEATVILDGQEVGKTPHLASGLAVGKHRVEIRQDGYRDFAQDIDLKPGKPVSVFAVLVKSAADESPTPELPQSFDVIHIHTTGRCSGLLVVNSDTIEYKAATGTDSFRVPVRSVTMVARDGGNTISGVALAAAVAAGTAAQAAYPNVPLPPPSVPVAGSASDPSAILPVRIETSGRKYSFVAAGGQDELSTNRINVSPESNQRLFDVANWLYRDTLKKRPGK